MTGSEKLFLIDTNVLIYAYDNSDKEKHLAANKILEKCWKGQANYVISSQNLAEFSSIITKKVKNPLDDDSAKKIISDISNFKGFLMINYNQKTIIKALEIKKEAKTSFWDSLLAATIIENNVFNIYTENEKDLIKIKVINIQNPFK